MAHRVPLVGRFATTGRRHLSWSDDAIAVFARNSVTGILTFVEKITSSTGGLLNGIRSVAVTPDGSQVLAVSFYDDALSIYDRNTTDGTLTFKQVIDDAYPTPDPRDRSRSRLRRLRPQ